MCVCESKRKSTTHFNINGIYLDYLQAFYFFIFSENAHKTKAPIIEINSAINNFSFGFDWVARLNITTRLLRFLTFLLTKVYIYYFSLK